VQALIGFVALGLIAVGAFWGLQLGGPVAQVITILVTGGLTYGVARVQERDKYQREVEAKLVSDKRLLYKSYLDLWRGYIGKNAKPPSEAEVGPKMQAFFFNAMLNASDEVIRAQNEFLRLTQSETDNQLVIPAMADVILAMRRDAGIDSHSLAPADIMRPLISDLDDNLGIFEQWEQRKLERAQEQRP
jgi:hypothetical protein